MTLKDLSKNHVFYVVVGVLIAILSCLFTKEWNPDYDFMSNIVHGYVLEWDCRLSSYGYEVCSSRLGTKWFFSIGLIIFAVGIFLQFSARSNKK